MPASDYQLFKPRRGGKNLGILMAGFSFFPIFGTVAVIMGSVPEGLAIIGFGLLIFVYVIQRYLGIGRRYGISENGIWLKTGRKSLLLANAEINSVTVLYQETLDAFIEEYSREILSSQGDMNISRRHRSSKQYNNLIRYVSVVITEEETRQGGPINITNYTVHIDGPVVLIETGNGESYLITPEDSTLFAESLRIT